MLNTQRVMPHDDDDNEGRKLRPRYHTTVRQTHGAKLTAYLATLTRDGEELIDTLLEIARQPRSTPDRAREARMAATWLAERLGGKPAVAVHLTGSVNATLGAALDPHALEGLDDDALDELESAFDRALPSVIDADSVEKGDA